MTAGEHRQRASAREVRREVGEARPGPVQPAAGRRRGRAGRARGGAGAGPAGTEGRDRRSGARTEAEPRPPAEAPAADRARDRAGDHVLSLRLRLRREGEDRRGCLRAARHRPRSAPRARDAPSAIRLPPLPGAVVQAHAPEHVVPGGLPTGALIAQVIVSKFGDHLRFYRQAGIYKRQGIALDRATLGNWVGRACFHLRPIVEHMRERLKAAERGLHGRDPGAGARSGGGREPSSACSGPSSRTIAATAAATRRS